MGNKETKVDVDQFFTMAGREDTRRGSGSKKALAAYLASLSDMAHTGIDAPPPEVASGASRLQGDVSPATFRRLSAQLRKKLQEEVPTNEDARKQLELLNSLQSQDEESSDWASMRGWLVWCMHTNLDEDDVDDELPLSSARRRLSRQQSLDAMRGRKLSHQENFDVNRDGRMSNQSSLESNTET